MSSIDFEGAYADFSSWQHCWIFWLARPELVGSAVKPVVVSADKMLTPEAVLVATIPHSITWGRWQPVKLPARSVVESVLAQTLANPPLLKSRPERVKPDVPPSKPYQGVWRQSPLHMAVSA